MISFQDLTLANWGRHEQAIMDSELMYPDAIRTPREEFINILSEGGFIAKIVLVDSEYAGKAVGYELTPDELPEYGLKDAPAETRVMYLMDIVISARFQGRGLGTLLLKEFIRGASSTGYGLLAGHFRPNSSLSLIRKLGATEKGVWKDWERTGEDYVLCSLDLSKQLPVPIRAAKAMPVAVTLNEGTPEFGVSGYHMLMESHISIANGMK